ncbi:hypothetical protein Glove_219g47 [Diversispora epigaea]|uniref:Uncharacterized protein n=1 Tax=Diversispora epigaea TaxID=1348612 RepID=A0A397IM74_9GLOM|nr:hypothetical protein Glove_219g47 [Diversispora epigaea]
MTTITNGSNQINILDESNIQGEKKVEYYKAISSSLRNKSSQNKSARENNIKKKFANRENECEKQKLVILRNQNVRMIWKEGSKKIKFILKREHKANS